MRIRSMEVTAFLIAWIAPAVAFAQSTSSNCPPGSWFCEESTPPATTSAPAPSLPPPAVTPPPNGAAPPAGAAPPGTTVIVNNTNTNNNNNTNTNTNRQSTPPVVIYQQAPPPPPPAYALRRPTVVTLPPPPPPPRHAWRKWGLNLRLQGVMMDGKQNKTSSMGGAGISLRARPVPHFALDFGLDAIGGRDYQGNSRSEVPFTINAMVYANPRNPVQFYMLGGIGWSSARVEYDATSSPMGGNTPSTAPYKVERYSYFGGQLGAGLEIRISQPLSLNIDLIGFVRGRTDAAAKDYPEFTNERGQTTNTSGGGLMRAGLTYYW